jgi:hypothetical protein
MSDTYDIVCRNCKSSLWIGQSSTSDPTFCFYTGVPETMEALKKFLYEHMEHDLTMEDSQRHEDYTKVVVNKCRKE